MKVKGDNKISSFLESGMNMKRIALAIQAIKRDEGKNSGR